MFLLIAGVNHFKDMLGAASWGTVLGCEMVSLDSSAVLFCAPDNTSSLKGNCGRDTPLRDVSTHDPYHNGTEAQPVVFDLDGNGIGIARISKSTFYMGEGAT